MKLVLLLVFGRTTKSITAHLEARKLNKKLKNVLTPPPVMKKNILPSPSDRFKKINRG